MYEKQAKVGFDIKQMATYQIILLHFFDKCYEGKVRILWEPILRVLTVT